MIDKLTRWAFLGTDREKGFSFEMLGDGEWVDFNEVKELLAEQEKKTKILLDALKEIINMEPTDTSCNSEGYLYYCIECAQEALEEYKKG